MKIHNFIPIVLAFFVFFLSVFSYSPFETIIIRTVVSYLVFVFIVYLIRKFIKSFFGKADYDSKNEKELSELTIDEPDIASNILSEIVILKHIPRKKI